MPKPVDLDAVFTAELQKLLEQAEAIGVRQTRLLEQVKKFGGVSCARELVRKGRLSDGFEALAAAKRLDLSLEALVTAGKYGTLFTDDAVNACFSALCDAGYYVF